MKACKAPKARAAAYLCSLIALKCGMVAVRRIVYLKILFGSYEIYTKT